MITSSILALAALVPSGCDQDKAKESTEAKDAKVTLDVVTLDQLEAAIKAKKGKIVVVDLWGEFCIPCKKEFPKLVQLHERHAKDGVVCMSVSIDTTDKKDAALAFLKAKGATFANYLIHEGGGIHEKWKFKAVPAVFVFNREGKEAKKFTYDDPDDQFTYEDVAKFVEGLIKGTEKK